MFIVFGILSILAGCFVFNQAMTLLRLSQIVQSQSEVSLTFLVVAICLILAGAFALASQNGIRHGFIRAASWVYGASFLTAIFNLAAGDIVLWLVVSASMVVFLSVWLSRHSPTPDIETIEFVDPDRVKHDDV